MRLAATVGLVLIAAACAPTSTVPPANPTANPVSVTIHLIHESPGEGLIEWKVERTGEILLLSPKPDLTHRDISWAALQLDYIKRRAYVLVHFSPVGREKLATLTRQNIGKRLAILVDGKVLSTPLIQSEVRDGRATIQGFRSFDEAQRVADSLSRQ